MNIWSCIHCVLLTAEQYWFDFYARGHKQIKEWKCIRCDIYIFLVGHQMWYGDIDFMVFGVNCKALDWNPFFLKMGDNIYRKYPCIYNKLWSYLNFNCWLIFFIKNLHFSGYFENQVKYKWKIICYLI